MTQFAPRLTLATLPILLFPIGAQADLVQYGLTLPATVEYESNPRMSTHDAKGVLLERIAPTLDIKRLWNANTLQLSLGAVLERSSNPQVSSNRKDPNLGFSFEHDTERDAFIVNGRYQRTSARASELAQTGLIAPDQDQTTKSLGGSWTRALTERTRFSLGANYSDVSYSGTGQGLTDYTTTGVTSSLDYEINERGAVFTSVGASRYEPQSGIKPVSNFQNVMLGYRTTTDEPLQWKAQVGVAHIEGVSSGTDWQAMLSGSYTRGRFNTSANLGRVVVPSGITGGFTNTTQVNWQASYALTERSRAGVQAGYAKSHSVAQSTLQSTTKIFGASFAYDVAPRWTLTLNAQHRKINHVLGNAIDNVVGLTLSYSKPDLF
jgi:hypothetical protein